MSYVELSAPRQVTTRKPHRCGWCNERIPAGTSEIWSRSYIWEDGPQSDWMHPECYEAMMSLDPGELQEGWMPGDFERGQTEWN